ncbi:aminoacyl-tRNA deacylase [Photobacterium kishitanii]|uniref:aminoacyl-tRNA deacylase n=2 Tax=Photobacterium kishitanii TaxID=318456 RepID=UPI001F2A767D|nr:YbaK/EbsC family protein [Photobacterium kishitanii]
MMAISTRLNEYLQQNHIDYQKVYHYHTEDSLGNAATSGIPPKMVAKAVLLLDHEGRKVMAVLAADKKINLAVLNHEFNAEYHLLDEKEVYRLFSDCEKGAIPPIGSAYNIAVIYDQQLNDLDNIYIEAGDHQTLLRLDHYAFTEIMKNAKHIHFSKTVYH